MVKSIYGWRVSKDRDYPMGKNYPKDEDYPRVKIILMVKITS